MDDDIGQITAVHGGEAISNDRQVSGQPRRPHGGHYYYAAQHQKDHRGCCRDRSAGRRRRSLHEPARRALTATTPTSVSVARPSPARPPPTSTTRSARDGQYVDEVAVTLTGDFHTGYTFTGAVTDGTGHNGAGGTIVQSGTCTAGSYTSGSTVVTCEFESTPRHRDHRRPRGHRGRLRAVGGRQQQLRHERDARRRLADQLSGRESPDNWSGLSPPHQPDRE